MKQLKNVLGGMVAGALFSGHVFASPDPTKLVCHSVYRNPHFDVIHMENGPGLETPLDMNGSLPSDLFSLRGVADDGVVQYLASAERVEGQFSDGIILTVKGERGEAITRVSTFGGLSTKRYLTLMVDDVKGRTPSGKAFEAVWVSCTLE